MLFCLHSLVEKGVISEIPIETFLAAISVGIVDDEILMDLCFKEDSRAQVDMNVVMNSKDQLIEVQSTAENRSFSREEFDEMLNKSAKAISNIINFQKKMLSQKIK
jgi:ribonuclease PH